MALLDWSKLNSSYSPFYPPPLSLTLSLSLSLSLPLSVTVFSLCAKPDYNKWEPSFQHVYIKYSPGAKQHQLQPVHTVQTAWLCIVVCVSPHYGSQSIERVSRVRERPANVWQKLHCGTKQRGQVRRRKKAGKTEVERERDGQHKRAEKVRVNDRDRERQKWGHGHAFMHRDQNYLMHPSQWKYNAVLDSFCHILFQILVIRHHGFI